jgi:holo-[acyl-carrier protein] synthase
MILPVISRRSIEHVLPLTSRPQGLILRKPLPSRPTESKSYSPEADPSTGSKSYLFDLNDVEGQMCEISISHDGGWAQAVAMVPDTNWMRDIGDTVPSSDTAMADMKRE